MSWSLLSSSKLRRNPDLRAGSSTITNCRASLKPTGGARQAAEINFSAILGGRD